MSRISLANIAGGEEQTSSSFVGHLPIFYTDVAAIESKFATRRGEKFVTC